MSNRTARAALQRTGAFSQNEKDALKNALAIVYADIETVEDAAGTEDEAITTGAAAGITGGTGTVVTTTVSTEGGDIPITTTRIFVDLTGLQSSTTDLDVIGQGVAAAYLFRVLAAQQGNLFDCNMHCIETPATGVTDIDLYAATVGTAVFDDGIAALTETALVTAGGAWAAGMSKPFIIAPAADGYVYLTCGAAGTVGTYTAGKFLIELRGTTL